jgi:sugar O-acyltransferase (sialic acid O-acetyltransferase NeuD family)
MGKKKLVIVGAGEFAEIAYEYFTYDSDYTVVGFSVESEFIKQNKLFELPILPFEEIEKHYPPSSHEIFVAITSTQLNRVRSRLYALAKAKGYCCANYISSKAFVWRNVTIGDNCFIFENNVIQHHAKIGNNVVLWSGNHIGHRAKLEDHCFISSHVVISGYTEIGEYSFLGVNSTFVDNIKVARDNFIGAGALINKSTQPGDFFPGVPAVLSKVSSYRYFKIKD